MFWQKQKVFDMDESQKKLWLEQLLEKPVNTLSKTDERKKEYSELLGLSE